MWGGRGGVVVLSGSLYKGLQIRSEGLTYFLMWFYSYRCFYIKRRKLKKAALDSILEQLEIRGCAQGPCSETLPTLGFEPLTIQLQAPLEM